LADLPKDELMRHAEDAMRSFAKKGLAIDAYFKATCPNCGKRMTFNDPNIIYDKMECVLCGTVFPFTKGGYLVKITRKT
jgi:hypothetical protein